MNQIGLAETVKTAAQRFDELRGMMEGARALLETKEEEGITDAVAILEVASRLAYETGEELHAAAA